MKKGNPKPYYNEQIKHIKCVKNSLFPPQVPNGQGTPEGDQPGPTPGIKMEYESPYTLGALDRP